MRTRLLIPIGSVVTLKTTDGSEGKKLMIAGLKLMDKEDPSKKIYDYLGVLYPEGEFGQDGFTYLFNHSDISKIVHEGFKSKEHEDYLASLAKLYGE